MDYKNFLPNNILKNNTRLYYIALAIITIIILVSLSGELVSFNLPGLIQDSFTLVGIFISFLLYRMRILSINKAAGSIVYLVMISQNALLLYSMVAGSDGYVSILMFTLIADFIFIFVSGFYSRSARRSWSPSLWPSFWRSPGWEAVIQRSCIWESSYR
jgi:hypothetical protein